MTVRLEDSRRDIADIVGRNYIAVLKSVVSRNEDLDANPFSVRGRIVGAVAVELSQLVCAELADLTESPDVDDYDEHDLREQTVSRRLEIAKSMILVLMRDHFFRDLGLMLYKGGVSALATSYVTEPTGSTARC